MPGNRFNYFLKPTLKFSLVGIFIPGFTAITFFIVQIGLTHLGVECSTAWSILWTAAIAGTIVLPIVFIRNLKKSMIKGYDFTSRDITAFNLIEYSFIQCAVASLFGSGKTLCNAVDGQNGLQFVFTGWIAIPILIILSLAFDQIRKIKLLKMETHKGL